MKNFYRGLWTEKRMDIRGKCRLFGTEKSNVWKLWALKLDIWSPWIWPFSQTRHRNSFTFNISLWIQCGVAEKTSRQYIIGNTCSKLAWMLHHTTKNKANINIQCTIFNPNHYVYRCFASILHRKRTSFDVLISIDSTVAGRLRPFAKTSRAV